MKTVGIIGGIAPESTVDYYRLIIATCRERTGNGTYPPILINSIDLKWLLWLIEENRLPEVADYLLVEIGKLARAGADFALLASNTPHLVFDEVSRRSPLPLVSIVESAAEAAEAKGLKKVGLLGTRFTMQGRFYPEAFARRGIEVCVPDAGDQALVHDRYMRELVQGNYRPETRAEIVRIILHLAGRDGIEAVLLAGTELPLLMRAGADCGVPLLDTTRIHVARVVEHILATA